MTETMTELGFIRQDIAGLRSEIRDLRQEISESHESKVSHREWSQRNVHVDGRLQGLGREIGDLRTEIRAKSAPWWSVVAVVISGLALVWSMIPK